ncbi:hypothetical protein STEG23_033619, partial [Scotinomys teguina]
NENEVICTMKCYSAHKKIEICSFFMCAFSTMNFPLSTAFIVSHRFGFHLIDLFIGWNLPSSAFCKAGFVDRLGLFMVS